MSKPLLTIGIPTYNRAKFLNEILGWLYTEVGNDNRFEILISDNASTDNTEEVVMKYKSIFSNLVYHKQTENIGADKNFKYIYDTANGQYIKLHGDDDILTPGSIKYIANTIEKTDNVDLFYINIGPNLPGSYVGTGYNQYLKCRINSMNITAITILVFKTSAYRKIENKDKYLNSSLYQVYIEMEILKNNPKFCLITGIRVMPPYSPGGRRNINIGEIFIKNYFDILSDYIPYGLSQEALKFEKKYALDNDILSLLKIEINNRTSGIVDANFDNLEEYYISYYKNEEYFEVKLNEIKYLLNILNRIPKTNI